ncbi:MAG: hypothetical protein QXK88_11870 [Desulfurococcaceae archaeon]
MPVAAVIPPWSNFYYLDVETIRASTWDVTGSKFCIEFAWKARQDGLYTITIYARNTLRMSHPYSPQRYGSTIPILEYSFYQVILTVKVFTPVPSS